MDDVVLENSECPSGRVMTTGTKRSVVSSAVLTAILELKLSWTSPGPTKPPMRAQVSIVIASSPYVGLVHMSAMPRWTSKIGLNLYPP